MQEEEVDDPVRYREQSEEVAPEIETGEPGVDRPEELPAEEEEMEERRAREEPMEGEPSGR